MNKPFIFCPTLIVLFGPLVAAQKWEVGAGAGAGFYTSQDVKGPAASGTVKIAPGVAASAWLANNNSRHWGGELRYDYQMGDLQVSAQTTTAAFGARTHALHYDFIVHAAPGEAPVQPFIAFGGGVKIYQGTGTEVQSQPLNDVALLTRTSDTRAMGSVGAGIKIHRGRAGFRLEVHDFITPFPDKVIAPAANAKMGGWLHDLVIIGGFSLLF